MVRRLLLTTLAYMAVASVVAALLGMAMANLFRPGDGVSPDIARRLLAAGQRSSPPIAAHLPIDLSTFSQGHFPGLIVLSLLLGIGLTLVRTRGSAHLLATTEYLFELGMRLVGVIARFAPIAVACFMFDLTMVFGWHLLVSLSAYVSIVVVALLIQIVVVFSAIVWILGGVQPLAFLRAVQEAALIAFCTSSSNATLPTALRVADEQLALPPKVARLVLGVGTVANQAGTAIYTGVTVLFLSQLFGTDLGIGQQAILFGVSTLAGMGTIGVPAGSLPIVAATLAVLGLPPECIGLVVGVDRLLDMFRTVVNVTGDLAIAVALSRKAV
jgi:DAACS family dicarboxylate/amino acid:cation (Na+ or H+) symporter